MPRPQKGERSRADSEEGLSHNGKTGASRESGYGGAVYRRDGSRAQFLAPVSEEEAKADDSGLPVASRMTDVEQGGEEDNTDEEAESQDERCEGTKSVGRKSPRDPTRVEKEEHERARYPYRSWCEHCMQSSASSSPHRNTPEEKLEELRSRECTWIICSCRGKMKTHVAARYWSSRTKGRGRDTRGP